MSSSWTRTILRLQNAPMLHLALLEMWLLVPSRREDVVAQLRLWVFKEILPFVLIVQNFWYLIILCWSFSWENFRFKFQITFEAIFATLSFFDNSLKRLKLDLFSIRYKFWDFMYFLLRILHVFWKRYFGAIVGIVLTVTGSGWTGLFLLWTLKILQWPYCRF